MTPTPRGASGQQRRARFHYPHLSPNRLRLWPRSGPSVRQEGEMPESKIWTRLGTSRASRRRILAGAATTGGALVFAACGGGGKTTKSASEPEKSKLVFTPSDTTAKAKPGGTL